MHQHGVWPNKLQRDAPSFRARKGCGAMCARKRCNHAVVLDNSTRMKKRSNDGAQSGVAYPKPAKRPSPSDFAGMGGGLPLGMSPMGGGANRNGQMNGGMMMPPSVLHSSPALHNRLAGGAPPNENRPGFHPAAMYGVNPADFSAAAGFPPSPFQMDPNANRVPGFATAGLGAGAAGAPNGMCIVPLPNGHFMNSPSFFFPQPLQPTQIVGGAGGKDVIKADDHSPTSAHNGSDDPFQPPSYRKEAGSSVVLQAL
ncbi:hypothetical protein M3Y99_00541800 [Aphelenchoides fujianensis]|nr:hypothetical protein M3Y99_00541800 [Aphelenchoides fujianensis]